MERVVAIKKLGKLLGKDFGYRVDPKAPNADERAAAADQARSLNAEFNAAELAEAARRKAILEGDAEYQRLVSEKKRLRAAKDEAWSKSRHHKIVVGKTVAGMFFSIQAEADSWEEAIEKVSKKKVLV